MSYIIVIRYNLLSLYYVHFNAFYMNFYSTYVLLILSACGSIHITIIFNLLSIT